eukprot:497840_1
MALQQQKKQGFVKLNNTDVIEDDESDDIDHEYNETDGANIPIVEMTHSQNNNSDYQSQETQETKHSETYDRSNDRSNNMNDEYLSSEEQNTENIVDILTEGIHKYNDDIDREEISTIVRAKQITDIQLQRLLNEPHCDQLAITFSILGVEPKDWEQTHKFLNSVQQKVMRSNSNLTAINDTSIEDINESIELKEDEQKTIILNTDNINNNNNNNIENDMEIEIEETKEQTNTIQPFEFKMQKSIVASRKRRCYKNRKHKLKKLKTSKKKNNKCFFCDKIGEYYCRKCKYYLC